MKLHFVGIGGIGTSALAQLCVARGDIVSGSNLGTTTVWPELEAAGITLYEDHKTEYLPTDADVLIYSEAVPTDNPERLAAKKLGIPQKSYFEYLGEATTEQTLIAVTGTHGKTTTTGMIASGFVTAHFPATVVVGSKIPALNDNNFAQIKPVDGGSTDESWAVVEACEYRNNFQYLNPEIVVVTNLELDHVDFYESEAHYLETFRAFCHKAKTVICLNDEPLLESVLEDFSGEIVRVNPQGFKLELDLPGIHNRANASLALAAAEEIQGLNIKRFKKGLKHYQGAARRLECLGESNGLTVYDDYGHHPTEIKATIQALRERHPDQAIGLIFEPHQYSRTREFFDAFLDSFTVADRVGLFPIYEARDTEADKKSVSRKHFLDRHAGLQKIDDLAAAQSFATALPKESILVFMGAGNISQLAHEFMNA